MFSIVSFVGMTGCNDEDIFEGTLEISSHNSMDVVWIYALEDTSTPVYEIRLDGVKSYSIKINAGNYQLGGYTNNGYFSTVTFQVRPENTTRIVYDSDNVGEVSFD